MRYLYMDISTQEVPDELSLAITITGCPLRCKGCHTPEARNPNAGETLSWEVIKGALDRYKGTISCVLFYGGEWDHKALAPLMEKCNNYGVKVALYTGLTIVPDLIYNQLHYLKIGPYVERKGGLNNPNTNQRMFNVKTGEDVTYKFQR